MASLNIDWLQTTKVGIIADPVRSRLRRWPDLGEQWGIQRVAVPQGQLGERRRGHAAAVGKRGVIPHPAGGEDPSSPRPGVAAGAMDGAKMEGHRIPRLQRPADYIVLVLMGVDIRQRAEPGVLVKLSAIETGRTVLRLPAMRPANAAQRGRLRHRVQRETQ